MAEHEWSAEEMARRAAAHVVRVAEMEAENAAMRAAGHAFHGCVDERGVERVFARGEAARVASEWFASVTAGKRFVSDGVSHVSVSQWDAAVAEQEAER